MKKILVAFLMIVVIMPSLAQLIVPIQLHREYKYPSVPNGTI